MDKLAVWNKASRNTTPVGHILRDKHSNHWFRVHSLPNSKRYPDTEQEISELKNRHITVANKILGDKSVTLFMVYYSDRKDPSYSKKCVHALELSLVESINIAEEDDEPYYLNIYVVELIISDEAYLKIIMDVASEELGPVVFFSEERLNAIAPYDGGLDIFLLGSDKLSTIKPWFNDWLSSREDGL